MKPGGIHPRADPPIDLLLPLRALDRVLPVGVRVLVYPVPYVAEGVLRGKQQLEPAPAMFVDL